MLLLISDLFQIILSLLILLLVIILIQLPNIIKDTKTKYINVETKDDASLNNFINELKNLNIIANMNIEPNANPSENYAIFEITC